MREIMWAVTVGRVRPYIFPPSIATTRKEAIQLHVKNISCCGETWGRRRKAGDRAVRLTVTWRRP